MTLIEKITLTFCFISIPLLVYGWYDQSNPSTSIEVFPSPQLLSSLRAVESSERGDVISSMGAMGYYQIMPETWREHSSYPLQYATDPSQITIQTETAVAYLRWIRHTLSLWEEQEKNSIPLSHILSCWHGGIGRFRSPDVIGNPDRMPGSTREFVRRMMRRMR